MTAVVVNAVQGASEVDAQILLALENKLDNPRHTCDAIFNDADNMCNIHEFDLQAIALEHRDADVRAAAKSHPNYSPDDAADNDTGRVAVNPDYAEAADQIAQRALEVVAAGDGSDDYVDEELIASRAAWGEISFKTWPAGVKERAVAGLELNVENWARYAVDSYFEGHEEELPSQPNGINEDEWFNELYEAGVQALVKRRWEQIQDR